MTGSYEIPSQVQCLQLTRHKSSLAQGHIGSAQAVKWHLSSYQTTLIN